MREAEVRFSACRDETKQPHVDGSLPALPVELLLLRPHGPPAQRRRHRRAVVGARERERHGVEALVPQPQVDVDGEDGVVALQARRWTVNSVPENPIRKRPRDSTSTSDRVTIQLVLEIIAR